MRRTRTLFVLWLTLVTVVPTVAIVAESGKVHAQGVHVVYLPWVSNNATIDGAGPWHGYLSFQNLSSGPCAMSIYAGGPDGWQRKAQLVLNGDAHRTVSANSMAVPEPGAPMRVDALCPVAASVKELTPSPRKYPWADGAATVAGYTGIAEADLSASREAGSSSWFLPIVQTNSDWNTTLRITNLDETTTTTAQVELYPNGNLLGAAGITKTVSVTIPAGDSVQIDALDELGGVSGWVGYASVRADGPVGVLAHRSKPSTRMAIVNVAVAADQAATDGQFTSSAPLLFSAYNGWNTGINLANVADQYATVTVRYFETGGSFVREETLSLPPRSMQYLYTPGNVDQPGFVGSATIESNVPLVGAIDEVKYQTTEAMSYMASSVPQTDAAIPITFKENPAAKRHDNSGINIANLNADAEQSVEITLFSDTGDLILSEPILVTLPAGGSEFVYLPFVESLPPGTLAAARLRSSRPAGFCRGFQQCQLCCFWRRFGGLQRHGRGGAVPSTRERRALNTTEMSDG